MSLQQMITRTARSAVGAPRNIVRRTISAAPRVCRRSAANCTQMWCKREQGSAQSRTWQRGFVSRARCSADLNSDNEGAHASSHDSDNSEEWLVSDGETGSMDPSTWPPQRSSLAGVVGLRQQVSQLRAQQTRYQEQQNKPRDRSSRDRISKDRNNRDTAHKSDEVDVEELKRRRQAKLESHLRSIVEQQSRASLISGRQRLSMSDVAIVDSQEEEEAAPAVEDSDKHAQQAAVGDAGEPDAQTEPVVEPSLSIWKREKLLGKYRNCHGCGVSLQSSYPNQAGFVSEHLVNQFVSYLRNQPEPEYPTELRFVDRSRLTVDGHRVPPSERMKQEAEEQKRKVKEEENAPIETERKMPKIVNAWDLARGDRKPRGQMKHFEMDEAAELEGLLNIVPGLGGTPRAKPKEETRESFVCERCHLLQHRGHRKWGAVGVDTAENVANQLAERIQPDGESVVIWMVDLFDVPGSLSPQLREITRGNPLILVGNKFDLLPRGAGAARIQGWLKREAAAAGLKPHSIVLMSAKSGLGVPELLVRAKKLSVKVNTSKISESKKMRQHVFKLRAQQGDVRRKGELGKEPPDPSQMIRPQFGIKGALPPPRNVYIVGTANVGKSTLINSLVRKRLIKGTGAQLVTESALPGTTLGMVAFPMPTLTSYNPFDPFTTLYDTPGVLNFNQLHAYLNLEELRATTPKSRIRPVSYRLGEGQSLLLGGFAQIDVVGGRPFFVTAVVAPQVSVHMTKIDKVERVIRKSTPQHIQPPFEVERTEVVGILAQDRQVKHFTVQGAGWQEAGQDIAIPGLGWVSFTGAGTLEVRVTTPPNIHPSLRPALMPYEAIGRVKRFHGVSKRVPSRPRKAAFDEDNDGDFL